MISLEDYEDMVRLREMIKERKIRISWDDRRHECYLCPNPKEDIYMLEDFDIRYYVCGGCVKDARSD